jgi:iron complex transport system permease protein
MGALPGPKQERRRFAGILVCLVIALAVSACVGKYPITIRNVGAILIGADAQEMTRKVFFTLRLPRTLMALIAGIALGVAGSVYQTVFKNPLASPDIIGVASGANLGSAAAIVILGGSGVAVAVGSFAGSLIAVSVVLLFVKMTRQDTMVTYVLAGIAITAVSNALIMMLKISADPENELAAIEYWTMGSLAHVIPAKLFAMLPFFLLSLSGLFLLRRQISLLSLPEDECRTLGVSVGWVRMLILGLTALLIASVISVTGLISFVGLTAPHIAKLMLRKNNVSTVVMSALVGGTVLLVSDSFARGLFSSEIPVSILTTLIGVPVLACFMLKKRS